MPVEQSEDEHLSSEALAQTSRSGRGQKLASASWRLAVLSCPFLWVGVSETLNLLRQRGDAPFAAALSVLMIVSVLALAPTAIITGHLAIARSRHDPVSNRVPRRAIFGAALGYINIVVPAALVTFAYCNTVRPGADGRVCYVNLRTLQAALRQYRAEHSGMLPPLSPHAGDLMFSPDAIHMDPKLLTCPTIGYAKARSKKAGISDEHVGFYSDQNYYYLGYAVFNDDDVETFAKAYRKQFAEGGIFDKDLVVEDTNGTRVLRRLSDNALRDFAVKKDHRWPARDMEHGMARRDLAAYSNPVPDFLPPVMIERDLGHVLPGCGPPPPVGAHVLFADEGVFFIDRGTWPMTEKTQRILAELAEN